MCDCYAHDTHTSTVTPTHLVPREIDEESLLVQNRGANTLQALEHAWPVVLGLLQHLPDGLDVRHTALKLTQVTIHRVSAREKHRRAE